MGTTLLCLTFNAHGFLKNSRTDSILSAVAITLMCRTHMLWVGIEATSLSVEMALVALSVFLIVSESQRAFNPDLTARKLIEFMVRECRLTHILSTLGWLTVYRSIGSILPWLLLLGYAMEDRLDSPFLSTLFHKATYLAMFEFLMMAKIVIHMLFLLISDKKKGHKVRRTIAARHFKETNPDCDDGVGYSPDFIEYDMKCFAHSLKKDGVPLK